MGARCAWSMNGILTILAKDRRVPGAWNRIDRPPRESSYTMPVDRYATDNNIS